MKKLSNLKLNQEYYFYYQNHCFTGFVVDIGEESIHIKNGNVCCLINPNETYAYDEAYLDTKFIICYAST